MTSATVFVSANQDGTLKKLLSAYRLYVNGVVVSVGPGRGNSANSAVNHTVYDSVDVTAHIDTVLIYSKLCAQHRVPELALCRANGNQP